MKYQKFLVMSYKFEFSLTKLNCLSMLLKCSQDSYKNITYISWSLTQNDFLQILHTFNLSFTIIIMQCLIFSKCNKALELQNCFAHSSATKYRSEAVLYSKRTAGHPLSSHIKTIATAFLLLYDLATKKATAMILRW